MIKVENISKSYYVSEKREKTKIRNLFFKTRKQIEALDNISFSVEDGEMVGYIGPNGAGKSSTIKILSGILTPDSGKCTINGMVPWEERVKYVKNIGVVFGQRSQLWWDLPVIESYNLLKEIYKIPKNQYKRTLFRLTDMLDLDSLINIPARQLSLGQRMRCEIVAALLHEPRILFLDEPTIGLDAVSKKSVRQFIKNINKESNLTLLLTTHDMQDIEMLTKRIIFLAKGKILFDGEIETIKQKYNKKMVYIKCKGNKPNLIEGIEIKDEDEGYFTVKLDKKKITEESAIKYLISRSEIIDITSHDLSTEEIVIQMYKDYQV
ncbi:ABC transporter [Lachnoclostridium sp. An169]|uniref:ABC transporter ATP-binding protein n=1 Tax=Lachnoclostridium sp. An169 TaxID=1965569 RepID=UPI000B395126|nr:ATP-binding cassette domain-containing protein [Lachnoclostridium sp. An169]OUP81256.1 ABC transporter [Lachnoclostridium sp. An169]